MNIENNLCNVLSLIQDSCNNCGKPNNITLIAVTKTRTPDEINCAIEHGITDIGENKVQEILNKYDKIKPVRWHMIGHLQTNKVRYIIDKVDLIQSVDSLKLAKEIDKRAKEHGRIMNILVQVNPADEESKFGVSLEEVKSLVLNILESCDNICIKGLMSVAPIWELDKVKDLFVAVKAKYDELSLIDNSKLDFCYLSMGMSGDFLVAIEAGSNMVRIGTAIFGQRDYSK